MRRRFWSDAEVARLRNLFPTRPTKEVARMLNRTVCAVNGTAHKYGIAKSQEFLDSGESGRLRKGHHDGRGSRFRFQKGIVPFNKGLRRPRWHTGRMRETQFKKGERSGMAARNYRPIGTIMPDTQGFLHIKVQDHEGRMGWHPEVWPMYNRYLWEQHHGPIPPKHLVVFKDGNRAHCVIENLELISMAENARRNRMWNILPRELAEVIQLQGVLKRKIGRLRDGKEQNQRPA